MAALCACEMGLKLAGVKLAGSGVQAAMDHFASHPVLLPLAKAA
jgi:alanine-glyoxylate transaminase/serine-glyoxylate transaminase/serine-pyruvate transaminase